jgi:hypothetical protein
MILGERVRVDVVEFCDQVVLEEDQRPVLHFSDEREIAELGAEALEDQQIFGRVEVADNVVLGFS